MVFMSITTWIMILPYNEVARWAYKKVNVHAQKITNMKVNPIAPLTVDNFHRIYQIPKPLVFL
jgi:hypothetical protein